MMVPQNGVKIGVDGGEAVGGNTKRQRGKMRERSDAREGKEKGTETWGGKAKG